MPPARAWARHSITRAVIADVAVLAPLGEQEILWRLLTGPYLSAFRRHFRASTAMRPRGGTRRSSRQAFLPDREPAPAD